MRTSWIMMMALAAFALSACGTSEPVGQCTIAADCTGDPGTGCTWLCTSGQCEADCTPECQIGTDCTGDPGTGCTWECISGECVADCTPECQIGTDCTGDPGTGCIWECISGECVADCPAECLTAIDCQDMPWLINCIGHWECNNELCEAVCGPLQCTEVSDCLDLPPPYDCSGHWECSMGECAWFCDSAECQDASECEGLPWPLYCLGHWECNNSLCEAVCDNLECESPADCEDLVTPCEGGEWLCENGLCIPLCQNQCETLADCLDYPWLIDCPGHWTCEENVCVENCDFENCGDDFCDAELGESAQSCPIDCLEGCQVPEDCENLPWPLDCPGHWECKDGVCDPVCDSQPECMVALDCAELFWDARCYGHWACEHGQCTEVCDFETCGDDFCDVALGETTTSCPIDCNQACQEPADCEDIPWPINCIGHWECRNGQCVPVCDAPPECRAPLDCLENEWAAACAGHWGCEQGRCVEVCDFDTCGDDFCDSLGGESIGSCPDDCQSDCEVPFDCLDNEWTIYCQGHWGCFSGTCVPVCESETCGDGFCDPERGESETSCNEDCSPQCQVPSDCLSLPWSEDCYGHWTCVDNTCQEECDFDTCGDNFCDRNGGESPQSCPDDCAVCVEEGMPTGFPPACCEGLEPISDCVPYSPCPGSLFFCVDCGDEICDPHENPYTCMEDCPQGCPVGEARTYSCPGGAEVPWCSCEGPDCQPICLYAGSDSEGWYDSCTGRLIIWATCAPDDGRVHEAVCQHIGTESEGWYDGTSGAFINWEYCAPLWNCIIDPKVNCH